MGIGKLRAKDLFLEKEKNFLSSKNEWCGNFAETFPSNSSPYCSQLQKNYLIFLCKINCTCTISFAVDFKEGCEGGQGFYLSPLSNIDSCMNIVKYWIMICTKALNCYNFKIVFKKQWLEF